MTLQSIQQLFNRAFYLSFSRSKLFFTFCVLVLCGLMLIFFRGMSLHANAWVQMGLIFLPIFMAGVMLMGSGIVLIRMYHDEIKHHQASLKKIVGNSWEVIVSPISFLLPFILLYLILWIALGVFVLLYEIPVLGKFFEVVFAFGPFVIHVLSLIVCAIFIFALFYVTPLVALKGVYRTTLYQTLLNRAQSDLFSHFFLFFIGLWPLVLVACILVLANFMTGCLLTGSCTPAQDIIQAFFIMIPFAALLTPFVIFFFNFSAESHVMLQKLSSQSQR